MKYDKLVQKLQQFEAEINENNSEITDALKHRGLLETHNNMLKEARVVQEKLNINQKELNIKK